MFYIIYKTTNIVNNKYYIGKHQTKILDDGYLGSGKLLKRAIKKHGIENFHKEILHVCKSEKHMNTLEKILVVPDDELNYNLCAGGKGGFGYINKLGLNKEAQRSEVASRKRRESIVSLHKNPVYHNRATFKIRNNSRLGSQKAKEKYPLGVWYGRNHSEETKHKMRKTKNNGSKNSQYGTCWITNSKENKKIKKEDLDIWIELGYTQGRSTKL